MEKFRILVLDGQNKNSLAVIRSLGKRGFYVGSIGNSIFTLSFFTKYVSSKYIIPKSTNPLQYVRKILEIAKKDDYDLIIPVGLESYVYFSKYRNEIDDRISIVLPPMESMVIASSKPLTFAFAKKNSVEIPNTMELTKKNIIDLKDFLRQTQFPVVVKGSVGGTDNLRYCNDLKQLRQAVTYLLKNEERLICQEYISGEAHGFYAYYNHGKVTSFFMHKRMKEFPPTGGASAVARSFKEPVLKKLGCKILDGLNWHGPAMVEFKLDKRDSKYKLIEINPKLWGSLDLTIAAGIDVPNILVNDALKLNEDNITKYNKIIYRWILPDEALHFCSTASKSFDYRKGYVLNNNIISHDLGPTAFQFFLFLYKFFILLIKGQLRMPSGYPKDTVI